jgi:hypothetical protein
MKYKLFDVIPEDIDELQAKECYSVGELGCCRDLIRISLRNPDSLALGFGVEKGTLHGIAGSYRQWDGAAQLWAIFDQRSCHYPVALTKICESLIDYAVKKQNLRRVSLTVKADYAEGNRFARFLNFDHEGLMRNFLPGAVDANLYARVF